MKWFFFVFTGFILFDSCNNQKKGIVFLAEKEYFDDGSNGTGFSFLTVLTNNKIYSYKKEHLIKKPEQFKNKKIVWGTIYFTGLKKSKTYPNIFFLILNYDSTDSQIIVDKNGDGDFTNDSLVKIEKGKWFSVFFQNAKDKKASFIADLLYSDKMHDSLYMELNKKLSSKQQGVLPANFIVLDKRRNYKKVILPDSNIVTLYDYDCNGFYNDKEDKILAGDIQKDNRIANNPIWCKNIKFGIELLFKNNTYKFLRVNKYGNSVELLPLNRVSDTIEKVVSFQFTDEKGKKKNYISKVAKDYNILYIWGTWCIGCQVQAPAFVKLMERYKSSVDYFTFNWGDRKEIMQKYLESKKYPFQLYKLDEKNLRKINVESYPSYILIDKKNRIILRTSSVEELRAFLKNK